MVLEIHPYKGVEWAGCFERASPPSISLLFLMAGFSLAHFCSILLMDLLFLHISTFWMIEL